MLRKQRPWVLAVLIGFVHGMIFLMLVPPWQHYDEPTNFEYAWLIANRGLPERGVYDQAFRRAVAASMIENDFFTNLDFHPNLVALNEPIWLGVEQLTDPPLYFLLVSVPLRFARFLDITTQLSIARGVSLGMLLITIGAAYGISRELYSDQTIATWLLPLGLALHPGFIDLMTSVNNDVGAVMFFTLFFWASLRLLVRGLTLQRGVTSILLAGACILTKETVYIAVPLVGLVFLITFFRSRRRHWARFFLLAGSAILLGSAFNWGDSALWYRKSVQREPTRLADPRAQVGDSVLQLIRETPDQQPQIYQPLLPASESSLAGKIVTLGAWIWADTPGVIHSPILFDGQRYFSKLIQVDQQPSFYATTFPVSLNAARLIVLLDPYRAENAVANRVYYDGLVLVEGAQDLSMIPEMTEAGGQDIQWGARLLKNHIRNFSGETAWPRLRRWVDQVGIRISARWPSVLLDSLLDWRWFKGYLSATSPNLFRSFWAKFGWGQVPLLGHKPYRILAGATTVLLLGAGATAWRKRFNFQRGIIALFAVAFIGIWATTVLGNLDTVSLRLFTPTARSAYPAIVPTMFLLNTGFMEALSRMMSGLVKKTASLLAIYMVLFLVFDGWAILSLLNFYWR